MGFMYLFGDIILSRVLLDSEKGLKYNFLYNPPKSDGLTRTRAVVLTRESSYSPQRSTSPYINTNKHMCVWLATRSH